MTTIAIESETQITLFALILATNGDFEDQHFINGNSADALLATIDRKFLIAPIKERTVSLKKLQ
jgi:hypothetical protein